VCSLFTLTGLRFLSGYSNSLEGTLPNSISKLRKLYRFDLHNNDLSGSIPSTVGRLNQIYYGSDLNYNYFDWTIPSSLGNLVLPFSESNYLAGNIPSSLRNLTSASIIQLYSNSLTGKIPPSLGDLDDNLLTLGLPRVGLFPKPRVI
jgi:hypothetical protein